MRLSESTPVVTVRRHPDGVRWGVGWSAPNYFQLTLHGDMEAALSLASSISLNGEINVGGIIRAKRPLRLGVPDVASIESSLDVAERMLRDTLARRRGGVR